MLGVAENMLSQKQKDHIKHLATEASSGIITRDISIETSSPKYNDEALKMLYKHQRDLLKTVFVERLTNISYVDNKYGSGD